MNPWREYQLSAGSYMVAKRCQCAPNLATDVVVGIHLEFLLVKLWLNQDEEISSVLRDRPQAVLDDAEITPAALVQWIGWEDAVRVIEFASSCRFFEKYPSVWCLEALIHKLHESELPGWSCYTLGGSGFNLVKDFVSWGETGGNAVVVNEQGISVFRTTMADGCGFGDDERLLFADTGVLDAAERLAASSCWEHCDEILNVHRSLRRWIFYAAAK